MAQSSLNQNSGMHGFAARGIGGVCSPISNGRNLVLRRAMVMRSENHGENEFTVTGDDTWLQHGPPSSLVQQLLPWFGSLQAGRADIGSTYVVFTGEGNGAAAAMPEASNMSSTVRGVPPASLHAERSFERMVLALSASQHSATYHVHSSFQRLRQHMDRVQ